MSTSTIEFPADFVFGSATAAHQVEGNNLHNDWWEHERAAGATAVEPSGIACDHYHRFADDFRLLRTLGQRAHRLSIEWSRIEPEEGQIQRQEIDHYRAVLDCLRQLDIEPWVTLHHFTLPAWFARRGGFTLAQNVACFRRFVERVAKEYGDQVRYWCTINEPTIHAELGHRFGDFPPRLTDPGLAADVLCNLFRAHAAGTAVLHAHACMTPCVGITLALQAIEPYRPDAAADRELAARRDGETNGVSLDALRTGSFDYPGRPPVVIAGLKEASQFVGVQYYTRVRYDASAGAAGSDVAPVDPHRTLTQMGWEIYPEGFGPLLRRAAATGLPVYVTENGIACDDDRTRVRFIADHLAVFDQVRREGADLRGYFYWSALDNFEWNFGYRPRFGLIAVDRTTLTRAPRPSAYFFGEIARTHRLTAEMVATYTK
ncbi:MAG: glycosyl hydrolase [Deltaproteobacteria bacterium]|nr:glycosyl hydrolase [Deltaproteobacteria bacterium]